MIIQLDKELKAEQKEAIVDAVISVGYTSREVRTQLGHYLIGVGRNEFDIRSIGHIPGVLDIHRVSLGSNHAPTLVACVLNHVEILCSRGRGACGQRAEESLHAEELDQSRSIAEGFLTIDSRGSRTSFTASI